MFKYEKLVRKTTANSITGCWEWVGARNLNGYGQVMLRGKRYGAHRAMWISLNGPIPEKLVIRHKCDNRCCINPHHLDIGTYQDNTNDAIERGRLNSKFPPHACKLVRKVKFTPEQIREIRLTVGQPLKEVAARYDTSMSYISEIRRGKKKTLVP